MGEGRGAVEGGGGGKGVIAADRKQSKNREGTCAFEFQTLRC